MNRVWTDDMLAELANVKMLSKLIGRCDPGKAVQYSCDTICL